MTPAKIVLLALILAAVVVLIWLLYSTRDRLNDWLDRRRLRGLSMVGLGVLLYIVREYRGMDSRGLGVFVAILGVALYVFERSAAPGHAQIRRAYQFLLLSSVALAVWFVATLPPPGLWVGLGFSALGVTVSLALLRLARSPLRKDGRP